MNDQEKNIIQMHGKKRRRPKISRWIFIGIVLVIACCLFVFREEITTDSIYVSMTDFFKGRNSKDNYPIEFNGDSIISFQHLGKNMALLTDTAFMVFSPSGNRLAERQHGFVKPTMVTTNKKAVIYERGGKKIQVHTRSGLDRELKYNEAVITADMNEKGCLAVIKETDRNLGEMIVYSKRYQEIFKWVSADNYISDVSVNSDGTKAAVALLNAEKGQMRSSVYIFDFTKKEPIAKKTYYGPMILSVQWLSSGAVSAVTDQAVYFFQENGEVISTFSYEGRQVMFYNDRAANKVSLIISKYGVRNEAELVVLKKDGRGQSVIPLKTDVKGLYADKKRITVLTSQEIHTYDENLVLYGKNEVPMDSLRALPMDQYVLLVRLGSISMIKYEKPAESDSAATAGR